LTAGVHLPGNPPSAESILERWAELEDRRGEIVPTQGALQGQHELRKAELASLPPPGVA
jgi:hypothetical protein